MRVLDRAAATVVLNAIHIYNYFFTYDFVFVEIDKGVLRGVNSKTWYGESYFSFKGIPYAKPPIGEFRFKGPREETAWAGVRDAISYGEVCPQVDFFLRVLRGEEDCLFLNVYTPSLRDEQLPVMVWIHGGIFKFGSGNDELYGSDYFMNAGVVLVTINYRVGALGFLSTGDDNAPGNAGMKDQVAALKWIRRNIRKFGGDPENVTLFGGSSGAACVHFHLLSPMSSGLFTKAISQSGSALNTWALSENGASLTVRLAEALGAQNMHRDTAGAIEFLKDAPYEDIVRVQETLKTPSEERIRIHCLFAMSVEKGVKSEEVFLPDVPLKILKSGNFNKVPYISGYNDQEGYFYMNELETPEIMAAAVEDTERHVPIEIRNKHARDDVAASIRKFYFGDEPIGNQNISNLVNLYTDTTFVADIRRAMKLHLQSANTPMYFYIFSYRGTMNMLQYFMSLNPPGAVHGDELGYLFHHRLRFWKTPVNGSSDEYVVRTMIRLWTNFAKYGNPTPPGDPLTWEPATIDKFNYLNISGVDMNLDENPDPERTNFWANVYEKYSTPHSDFCSQETFYQYQRCTEISYTELMRQYFRQVSRCEWTFQPFRRCGTVIRNGIFHMTEFESPQEVVPKAENDHDVVESEDGTEAGDAPLSVPVPICLFGNLTMKIGDKLNMGTDYNSVCVKCVCEVPPIPTF